MHVKFLSHGQGSAAKAIKYLIQEIDHTGRRRSTVEVLRGNPDHVAYVADSLKFKYRYRSAVIAWAPEDRPTRAQKEEVLDMFERVAFAGLESDQYTYLAVDHGDHIHIIVPRVELRTGKSLNIAPPGWQKIYDPIRDYFNAKYSWRSPDVVANPQNARTISGLTAHNLPKSVKLAKEMIHKHVLEAIERGLIRNRADMELYLADIGQITRKGRDYISIKPEGFKKAIRLKGGIYGEQFDRKSLETLARTEQERDRSLGRDREQEAQRLFIKVERIAAKRAEYHRKRYKKDLQIDQKRSRRDRGIEQQDQQIERMANRDHKSDCRPTDRRRDTDALGAETLGELRGRRQDRVLVENLGKGEVKDDRDREKIAATVAIPTRRVYETAQLDLAQIQRGLEPHRIRFRTTARRSDERDREARSLFARVRKRFKELGERFSQWKNEYYYLFAARIEELGRKIDSIRGRLELTKIGIFSEIEKYGESLKNILQLNDGQEYKWGQKMR